MGETAPSITAQAAHLPLSNGIDSNLTAQQFQGFPNQNPQKNLQAYQAGLSHQQQKQMPGAAAGGPPNQGSPMMTQGADVNAMTTYGYGAGEMGQNGVRGAPGGQQSGQQGNHALQDYQMQLMLLEQQNKKRLMMARQEQGAAEGQGGPGGPGMGPNGPNFPQGTSPQSGPRSVNSPNPSEQQMKRGTPHMNNPGIPSPLPEGQNRGSPSAMNFNMGQPGQMDAGMNPQFYKMNDMNGNMMANGMRPPSSHPGFPQGMSQQQMMMARQQAGNWQNGPNGGAPMVANPSQGPPQAMGTPQQRNMPPPAAPANAGANGRTQPSSPQGSTAAPPTPQQSNKANPKKKNETKETKTKVNFLAFNGFFVRNVDIDNSGLQRKDPPQTSTLVLHPPPTQPKKPLPPPQRPRSPRFTRRRLSTMVQIQTVLFSPSTVNLWRLPRTLELPRRSLIL